MTMIVACALLCLNVAAFEQAGVPDPEEGVITTLREQIIGGDWEGAYKTADDFSRTYRGSNESRINWHQFPSMVWNAARYSEKDASRKRYRALVAQSLHLYDIALENFILQINLATSEPDKNSARSGTALCAYRAAIEAVASGDLDRAGKMFDYMRQYGDSWIEDAGKRKGAMVRRLAESTSEVDYRIEFARKFWIENVPALGAHYDEARQFLMETLALTPNNDQRRQICFLIQSYSQELDDLESATAFADRIGKAFDNRDIEDESAFSLAQYLFRKEKHEDAKERLMRIVESDRDNKWVSLAHLGLSEVYAKLGDDAGMIRHLEKAACAPKTPTNRGIMDTSDTVQTALVRLGKHYLAKGEYEKAISCFKQWKPQSWCGNGQAQFAYEQDFHIAECLVALGRVDEALAARLMPHLTFDGGELYQDERIPILVVQEYEKRGELEKFLAKMKSHASAPENGTARIAQRLAQIRIWRRDGNTASLIDQLQDEEYTGEWKYRAVAQALSEFNGKEFPALKKRFYELMKQHQSNDNNQRYVERRRVLRSIGLSCAPEARHYLGQLKQRAEGKDSWRSLGVAIHDIEQALSLRDTSRR